MIKEKIPVQGWGQHGVEPNWKLEEEGGCEHSRENRKKRIIVVGLHQEVFPDLTETLRTFGCIPVRLRDSLQLFEDVRGCSVDGILCDHDAMSLKGFAVVTHLRKRSPVPPLLVITRPLKKMFSMDIFGNGAKDFMTKPLNNKEFCEKCTRLFKTEAPHS